jgi:type VI secretion system protein ImpC
MAGGEPYGALIGDYEFTNHPDDIALLQNMSNVAAASVRAVHRGGRAAVARHASWESSASRATSPRSSRPPSTRSGARSARPRTRASSTLVMPRTLSRLPYGKNTKPIEEFDFEEVEQDKGGVAKGSKHDQYCWSNAAYAMGST